MRKPIVRSILLAFAVLMVIMLAGTRSSRATVTCPIEYYPVRTCVLTPEDGIGVRVYLDGSLGPPSGVLVTCIPGGAYYVEIEAPGYAPLKLPPGGLPAGVPCLA